MLIRLWGKKRIFIHIVVVGGDIHLSISDNVEISSEEPLRDYFYPDTQEEHLIPAPSLSKRDYKMTLSFS